MKEHHRHRKIQSRILLCPSFDPRFLVFITSERNSKLTDIDRDLEDATASPTPSLPLTAAVRTSSTLLQLFETNDLRGVSLKSSPMAKFTAKFAVDDRKGVLAYDSFIKDLRRRLAVGDTVEGIPTLAPQVAPGGILEFFDVDLSYGTTSRVYFKFRTDNLYLVGYRPHSSTIWYELGPKDLETPLINEPGTTTELLGFSSSWSDFILAGQTYVRDIKPSSLTIGQAITELMSNRHVQDTVPALVTLTLAISEAIKFRDISSLICKSWSAGSDGVGPDGMQVARMYSWARLSSAVQRVQNEGLQFEFGVGRTDIWNFEEAILVLGIMHLTNAASSCRLKNSITNMALTTPFSQGQPLIEIFYVRVNSYTDNKPQDLYGFISVFDNVQLPFTIWKCNETQPISAKPGEDLVLNDLSRPLSAADAFSIEMRLWNTATNGRSSEGVVRCNPFDYHTRIKYDVPTTRRVSLAWCSMNVSCMAITNGLYATISIILIRGDKEMNANVYGDITASNGFGQTLLFRKVSDKSVLVKRQYPIPLSKALVAVPTDKTLRVNADLYDSLGSDDRVQIAWGSVEFQPLYMRSESKRIVGASGVIEGKVDLISQHMRNSVDVVAGHTWRNNRVPDYCRTHLAQYRMTSMAAGNT
ncbi:hypothetical protein D9757_006823 [Collybiopsis confluens]|uniref:rRNA N-glycosylase n=1 Tax=Collybiopsis confluens TaxID=2823264 RepID=A0A8H5MAF2_9AGAR|nr:hypothetical protein D9757_006823 [Collybiopsis confluens]